MEYDEFLLKPEVLLMTRLSDSTIWRLERKGKFPKRFTIGEQRVAWAAAEVHQWLDQQRSSGVRLSGGQALIAAPAAQARRVERARERAKEAKRLASSPPRPGQGKHQRRSRA